MTQETSLGKISVYLFTRLIASPRHQMPVARERFLNGGMAHELLNGLRVDPGVDQQRREGVAALVKRKRGKKIGIASLPLRFLLLALI